MKHVFLQNNAIQRFCYEQKMLSNNNSVINGSGVNLEKFSFIAYPESEKVCRFLYAGRIMDEKGIPELLEVAQRILPHFPQVEFHLIGGCESGYEARMQALQGKRGIFYHGQQKDVRPFLEKAHCLIHPSYHEGLSNVCLEAAACGRPIIASDIPGCRETFDEGISGFGIEPKNVDALEDAIRRFLALPHEAKQQMGIAGRQKVEREFDRNDVVQVYLSEVESIL